MHGWLGDARRGDALEADALVDAADGLVAGWTEDGVCASPGGFGHQVTGDGSGDAPSTEGGQHADADHFGELADRLVAADAHGLILDVATAVTVRPRRMRSC